MTPKQLAKKDAELGKLTEKIRAKGYSLETERSYRASVGKYITYICGIRWKEGTPAERKVEAFLTAQARPDRDVAASTQNAMFHAICFYYKEVRKEPVSGVDALRPNPERVPSPIEKLGLVA